MNEDQPEQQEPTNPQDPQDTKIIFMSRIAASAKKKLKQDARNLGMPMNRYLEQLIWGELQPPEQLRNPEPIRNDKGEIELKGGGTFVPAEGYEHLRVKNARKC